MLEFLARNPGVLVTRQTEFAIAQTRLITALPVFRAHISDVQLARDGAAVETPGCEIGCDGCISRCSHTRCTRRTRCACHARCAYRYPGFAAHRPHRSACAFGRARA